MNGRERYRRIIRGEAVDRLPYSFGWPRQATFEAWRRQGLSDELMRDFGRFIGADGSTGPGMLYDGPVPAFGERVVEETGNKRVWVDHWGVTRVDAIRQPTEGFSPRRYLRFPVETREDFEAMKWRFDPLSAARFSHDPAMASPTDLNPDWYRRYPRGECWEDRVDACRDSRVPVRAGIAGLFWRCRDWCGMEGLSLMFRDMPDLVHEMMSFWTDFLVTMLEKPLTHIKLDEFILNEDMAYKTASMISPADMREFMLPHYRRIHNFLKSKGVECVVMDSDGHNGQILDVFYPHAIDGVWPMEIAAGNDPAVYLARHPGLYVSGGIDKRELRTSRERVRAEVVRRFGTARRFATYVPSVDHGVPPDVPLRNFLYMVGLMRGFADGEDLDTFEPSTELEDQLGEVEEMFDPTRAISDAYNGKCT